MNCFNEIDIVIDYIERKLFDVNYAFISKTTGIPIGLYQRIFSYVCGITISEYIRRRKLTLAAEKILKNSSSIIDIALECGYDSHSSFTRAFKEQFSVPPKNLTSEIYYNNSYNRFTFHDENETYFVVKGRKLMTDLVKIEYEKMSARKLIGIQKRATFPIVGAFWREYFESGTAEKLSVLDNYLCIDIDDYIGLDHVANFDDSGTEFDVTIGKYYTTDTPVPKGCTSVDIPEGIIAKAQIKGTLNDIIGSAYILLTEAIKRNGYNVDYENLYWCGVYTYERYCIPSDNEAKELILDFFMPCKKGGEIV